MTTERESGGGSGMRSLRAAGTEVRYREWPGPSGFPPLVLVHGFLVHHREWEALAPRLAERRRVFALDLPGCGESPLPHWQGEPTFQRFADTVVEFSRSLGVGPVDLIGHSMGGGIAVVAAVSFEQAFRRLVLVDALSFPFPLPFKGRLPLLPGIGGFLFKRLYGRSMFVSYFRNDVVQDPACLDAERLESFYRAFDPPNRREYQYRVLRMTTDTTPVSGNAHRVTHPALVLWGERDRLIPRAVGERLEAAIPVAKLEVVGGSGHSPGEEKPAETAALIDRFLSA